MDDTTTIDLGTQDDMRFLTLIDLDNMFAASPDAVIINNIDPSAPDYVKQRNAVIFARSGELNFVASCNCGVTRDNNRIGVRCSVCGTLCRDDFASDAMLEHNTWLSIPPEIPGVLHPVAYIVLSKWLPGSYLDAILDPAQPLPAELSTVVLGRGHTYFYQNFDYLMNHFLHVYPPTAKKKGGDYIAMFIRNYRDILFCTKLPVMSSVLNAITSSDGSTKGRQYADASAQTILDAAVDLASMHSSTAHIRPNSAATIVQRVYRSYIGYLDEIAETRLSKKKSIIRRHVLGTRLHFSFRAVIIPHEGRYDELYLPWSSTVNTLKMHILNRLMNVHGLSVGDAVTRQITALMRYDPVIDKIMQEMITESPFPGLPCLWNRPPSLMQMGHADGNICVH